MLGLGLGYPFHKENCLAGHLCLIHMFLLRDAEIVSTIDGVCVDTYNTVLFTLLFLISPGIGNGKASGQLLVFRFVFCGKWKGWWHLGDSVSESRNSEKKNNGGISKSEEKNSSPSGSSPWPNQGQFG